MAVTYTNAVKLARMAAVVTQAGTTAVLEIGATGMASILATITLGNPIAGAATGAGVLTLSGFPRSDTSADNTGTAAAARVRTASGGTACPSRRRPARLTCLASGFFSLSQRCLSERGTG